MIQDRFEIGSSQVKVLNQTDSTTILKPQQFVLKNKEILLISLTKLPITKTINYIQHAKANRLKSLPFLKKNTKGKTSMPFAMT